MSGHSKWAQIKRQKGSEDAKRSKVFSKLASLISQESKRARGDVNSPSLRAVIEKAKKENMPKDTIDRAVKKGASPDMGELFEVTYEAYGPGGCAIIIEGLTDSKNRSASEIKHLLLEYGATFAAQGAASWAFKKENGEWIPQTTIPLSEEDGISLSALIEELEERDDVQSVFTNGN
ncbi:MAG: YebC/PmpR family DNA-binding transcriptional regulator [Patescibacteria group bacterium]